jgi:hypothetical protein
MNATKWFLLAMAFLVKPGWCVVPDTTTPEFRMGLENYYAKLDSDDLLTRDEVARLVNNFQDQIQCAIKKLPKSSTLGLDWANLRADADHFKNSPYSANQTFRFYASRMLVELALTTAASHSDAVVQCLEEKDPKLLGRLLAHIQLLTYAGDVTLATQNYPGGPAAFARDVPVLPTRPPK